MLVLKERLLPISLLPSQKTKCC